MKVVLFLHTRVLSHSFKGDVSMRPRSRAGLEVLPETVGVFDPLCQLELFFLPASCNCEHSTIFTELKEPTATQRQFCTIVTLASRGLC